MKKILSLFFLLTAGTAIAQQTQTTQQETKPNPNAAEIKFEEEVHDFGTIPFGGNGVYDFKFTNVGKEPLIISNAKGSCGCTVPKWSKEPIMSNQSGTINVSYDTKRQGAFTKTVTVTSNAATATKTLTIKGTVLSQEETENQTPVKRTGTMTPVESPVKNQ